MADDCTHRVGVTLISRLVLNLRDVRQPQLVSGLTRYCRYAEIVPLPQKPHSSGLTPTIPLWQVSGVTRSSENHESENQGDVALGTFLSDGRFVADS